MNLTLLLDMLIALEQAVETENPFELRKRVIDAEECVLQIQRVVARPSQPLPPQEERFRLLRAIAEEK